jgi:hypothetical protein
VRQRGFDRADVAHLHEQEGLLVAGRARGQRRHVLGQPRPGLVHHLDRIVGQDHEAQALADRHLDGAAKPSASQNGSTGSMAST